MRKECFHWLRKKLLWIQCILALSFNYFDPFGDQYLNREWRRVYMYVCGGEQDESVTANWHCVKSQHMSLRWTLKMCWHPSEDGESRTLQGLWLSSSPCFLFPAGNSSPAASSALDRLGQHGTPLPTQCSLSGLLQPPLPSVSPLLTLFCGKVPAPAVSSFFPFNPATWGPSNGQSVHTDTSFPPPLLFPFSFPTTSLPFLLSFSLACVK